MSKALTRSKKVQQENFLFLLSQLVDCINQEWQVKLTFFFGSQIYSYELLYVSQETA